MKKILQDVKKALREAGTAETRETAARFFKEGEKVRLHGVKSAEVRKIAKQGLAALKKVKAGKEDIFALCGELWKSGYTEEIGVACEWAYAQRKAFLPDDLVVFVHWLDNYVSNWAACDTLCNHTVGDLITMYPELAPNLLEWTASPNRWMQRGAAVTLIIPARKGLFHREAFAIADALLESPDDIVQKGYGWMLKAVSEVDPQAVLDYLLRHKAVMPRTAYRYAVEKMPPEMRTEAMRR